MKLPIQALPVERHPAGAYSRAGVHLSCAGVPNNELGSCAVGGDNPGILHRLNCTACCARRDSLSWFNGNYAVNC